MAKRITVTYSGCGHRTRVTSDYILSPRVESTGNCQACEAARLMREGVAGAPFLDDSHVTFDHVHEAVMRSEKNRTAIAGRRVENYGTGINTARALALRENLLLVELPEYLPPTRVNGEPYKYALVRAPESGGSDGGSVQKS